MKIISENAAKKWSEGYPLGNGQMGAMVLSGLPKSLITLSENTFYSGEKSLENNRIGADRAFYKMREQAVEGHFDKVHEIAEDFIGIRKNYGTNLPVGTLSIDYGLNLDETVSLCRTLDIETGIAVNDINSANGNIKEEVFISHKDHILICHINTNIKSPILISYIPSNDYGKVEYKKHILKFSAFGYETMHCDEPCGVTLSGIAKIVTDGKCSETSDALMIQDASEVLLYLYMNTDFKRTFDSKKSATKTLMSEANEQINLCMLKGFDTIRRRHIEDVRYYMERVTFQLEQCDSSSEIIPMLFQYGRYLLLSSSREDSKLPAHLQGIWNDNVACRIGWTCDMHLDINTQMNYWPAEVTNLQETTKPLFEWIQKDLSKSGELTAAKSYGLSGWVAELVSNAWGFSAPYWASPIAPCPTGGVWILMQMWEHYLYKEDEVFLEKTAFPLICRATDFFNGYVFKEKGTNVYTSGPSISPENSFLYQNKSVQISNGCTYEILMIRELFQVYLTAAQILCKDNTDLYKEISYKYDNLIPYRVLEDGTLAEWSHNLPSADTQHRHTSHLLGLYPFAQITKEDTPELCEAVKKTLHQKLSPKENWEDTGWARSLLILYEARLQDGNAAYNHIKHMITNLLEPNNLVYHPPTRGAYAFDHVYELDGNTGLITAIAEMLLQSHKGILHLLPALPDVWKSGSIKGLKARGNITVDIYWNDQLLQSATLISEKDKNCMIKYNNHLEKISLIKGVPYIFCPK